VLPPPAVTSDVLTPAVELKPSDAEAFTPSVAPKPVDAVKVPPQYIAVYFLSLT